jgi:beta-lactamase class D
MVKRLFLAIFCCTAAVCAEETFVLLDDAKGEVIQAFGEIDQRFSPCSTFKIPLSLMGFDAGILIDEDNPEWPDREEYDHFVEAWKAPQTPRSWMKFSCVWYSQELSPLLGLERMQDYLGKFEYGNQDMSGGVTRAWLTSSLKISPQEQVAFLRKLVREELSLSQHAVEMTKIILFKEELPEGWKLFGKTGWSGSNGQEHGWFVGWIEKDHAFFPFAYLIREQKIDLGQRIPRAKQLLVESGILN